MNQKNIAIYGVGAFGYAILKHLDNKQDGSYTITGYDHVSEVTDTLKQHRHHPFFHTDTMISSLPTFVDTPEELLSTANIIIVAVSSDATREIAKNIKTYAKQPVIILNIAKALDKDTGKRLSQIMAEELTDFTYRYALLAGGTIADDLFRHEPLGVDIASEDQKAADFLKDLFTSSNLSVYTTTDLIGVEYASALKNVISILAGIVKGLGFSYGSETHIISTTAQQIADVCVSQLGARADTFTMGRQSWGNDMWMSCTGETRNRQLGILLGEGVSAGEALSAMHKGRKLVEGVNTLQIIDQLPGLKDIPIVKLLHDVLVEKTKTVDDIHDHLLTSK
ncbi:NAD(P)H-dependent glycerol-3-phosphate dehydrogenase [soil metagenome]